MSGLLKYISRILNSAARQEFWSVNCWGVCEKVIYFCCAILLVFWVFSFLREAPAPLRVEGCSKREDFPVEDMLLESRPWPNRAAELTARPLFRRPNGLLLEAQREKEQMRGACSFLSEGAVNLVGIIEGPAPLAVIEQGTGKETLFLSLGEELQGARLKSLRQGTAVFECAGREMEVRFVTEGE